MHQKASPLRVLYSFPHRIGANRICYAAWQHVQGLAKAGASVIACPASVSRPLDSSVRVIPTLSIGPLRLPFRLVGRTVACTIHDWIVAQHVKRFASEIDLVHTFPLGALRTLKMAKSLGIPTILERCNAHTEFAYTIVQKECEKLGISMPPGHEHDFNAAYLAKEEAEYREADFLFCPSEFVARTFKDRGFPEAKLGRFQYGFDEKTCYPPPSRQRTDNGLTVLFSAGCAPRKGLHYALEAWLKSPAHKQGKFLVVGEFIPGYAERLGTMLQHPSVQILGYRKDLPDIMRQSDILVLPSIEEGSALVTYDARGCGAVLLVSDASGAVCQDRVNALVHPAGDVAMLSRHITELHENRALLEQLRAASLTTAHELRWSAAGGHMMREYLRLMKVFRGGAANSFTVAARTVKEDNTH